MNQGFGPYSKDSIVTAGTREECSYEFNKVATYGIRKVLKYSTVDAVTLWVSKAYREGKRDMKGRKEKQRRERRIIKRYVKVDGKRKS